MNCYIFRQIYKEMGCMKPSAGMSALVVTTKEEISRLMKKDIVPFW
jgi:hypothetical protein